MFYTIRGTMKFIKMNVVRFALNSAGFRFANMGISLPNMMVRLVPDKTWEVHEFPGKRGLLHTGGDWDSVTSTMRLNREVAHWDNQQRYAAFKAHTRKGMAYDLKGADRYLDEPSVLDSSLDECFWRKGTRWKAKRRRRNAI